MNICYIQTANFIVEMNFQIFLLLNIFFVSCGSFYFIVLYCHLFKDLSTQCILPHKYNTKLSKNIILNIFRCIYNEIFGKSCDCNHKIVHLFITNILCI